MRTFFRFVILSLVLCCVTYMALVIGIDPAVAKESGANQMPAHANSETFERGGNSVAQKVVAAQQINQPVPTGIVVAPRDVVDLTRLVLETSRDQTSHLAHLFERATTVIVIFFTVLGAGGAVFGLYRLADVEKTAAKLMVDYETRLNSSHDKVIELEKEFLSTVETANNKLREKLETADKNLQQEIENAIVLMTAKADMDEALRSGATADIVNRKLLNASARIEKAIATEKLSISSRIRGLANIAWAQKRLGNLENARKSIAEAIHHARTGFEGEFDLLIFNSACYSCLLGNTEESLALLKEAIQLNPQNKTVAKSDPDLTSLRGNPKFQALVA